MLRSNAAAGLRSAGELSSSVLRVFRTVLGLSCVFLASFAAQETPPEHQHDAAPRSSWTWTTDANIFVGHNYQQRRFLDYSAWESQNWFMAAAARPIAGGELTVQGMLSLERFTIARQGSPQLYGKV